MAGIWTKICGIRDIKTALAVAECGPQAIGLNFYARSPRFVSTEVARHIGSRLPSGVEPVGVFVNHSIEEIKSVCQTCRMETVQLHGDEPAEMVAALSSFRVIRAFRVGDSGLDEVAIYLEKCRRLNALPCACLIDARVEGVYGGTGQVAPWDLLRREYDTCNWPPLILAGGLRPENVATAVRTVQPWGVDVAGGVESTVACKDIGMVRKFVEAARGIDDRG